MNVEFYVNEHGEPAVKSESWVLDELLTTERAYLPAVFEAAREIKEGRRAAWEGCSDTGWIELRPESARLGLDFADDQAEVPLDEFYEIVRSFLAFKASRWKRS